MLLRIVEIGDAEPLFHLVHAGFGEGGGLGFFVDGVVGFFVQAAVQRMMRSIL